ncbi:MAG: hypothetical protein ACLGI5_04460 [Thermoleophilia bacterium]
MSDSRPLLAPLAVVCLVAIGLLLFLRGSPQGAPARDAAADGARYAIAGGGPQALPPAAPLRFAPQIAASDREVVLRAIGEARPEARRLVELVAGLVTVEVGPSRPGTAGMMTALGDRYLIRLDLGAVHRRLGLRGVRRLVLHELGHVVDAALVPTALEQQLDGATPAGFGCDDGTSGGCAAREERFAESFAKWATGDAGHDLYIGYRVPPPLSLAGWGQPLVELTR